MAKIKRLAVCTSVSVALLVGIYPVPSATAIGTTQNGKTEEHCYTSVEQMPLFPGGNAALMRYIQRNLIYPPEAAEAEIQGQVVVQFVVRADGSIGEARVARSVHESLDNEAIRVVKTLPRFTPGRTNGRPVAVWYTIPVVFRLPD